MGQTGTKIIALMLDKNLGFMLEPPKTGGMDDAVAVTLKARPVPTFRLGVEPAATVARSAGIVCGHDPYPCRFNLAVLYWKKHCSNSPQSQQFLPKRDGDGFEPTSQSNPPRLCASG